MLRCAYVPLTAVLLVCWTGCVDDPPVGSGGEFEAKVNPALQPVQPTIPDLHGNPMPVAASLDEAGVQSDFVESVILLKPKSDAELQAFLDRYGGTIIDDDTIPEPPPELGITLTPEQRRPTEFTIRISLSTLDLADMAANAAAAGLRGVLEFSSEAGRQTFAGILDAKVAGFDVSGDYISRSGQALPVGAIGVVFDSQERATSPGVFTDAFAEPRYGSAGSVSNVALAWQFLFAHSIQRRVRVAIIDNGFWLDGAGQARGTNSDFPPPPGRPTQYDFTDENAVADGANTMGCGAGNPCFWHGTGAASVATGIADNRLAYAGTGGYVADPLLFRFNGARDQRNQAVRTAVAWGADVVSMSFGGDCNLGCRIADRDETPFADAVNAGSRVVFIASAGNGRGTPATGYDVGEPSFVHPCIEDHVLCVGALADNSTAKTNYSNFGAQVAIFAPTNIPVMSYPNSFDASGNPLPISQAFGPEMAQPSFGGTSASAPFVAGVAAMMKALNPDLTGADVRRILVETARPAVPPATRCIDALAAVRRAAESIPIHPDRFERNDLESEATNLGATPPYSHPNLNIDSRDRDYFRFESPGGSTMTLQLEYPAGLGTISVFDLASLGGGCELPVLLSDTPLAGSRGRTLTYRVPGGPMQLALSADSINAYHLNISFAGRTFDADVYEPNNTVATARHLYSVKPGGSGLFRFLALDPRVSINATLHHAGDIDYYIVRGADPSLSELVFLLAQPAVSVYGNDSPINLQVFRLAADGTQGEQVGNVGGASCTAEPLSVRLDADAYYLVRVSGSPGRYTLRNGVDGDRRRLPILVQSRAYEVLNPLDPITRAVRFPELYVYPADRAYSAVRVGPRLHTRLFDVAGALVSEGVADGPGERLSLAAAVHQQVYALEVTRTDQDPEEPILTFEWESAEPVSTTANLLANPGAETTFGDPDSGIPLWSVIAGTPRIIAYDDQTRDLSPDSPGPQDRGMHLFSGGPGNTLSSIRQVIAIDPSLWPAIDAGRVKMRFSAFLGGRADETDATSVSLVLRGAGDNVVAVMSVPPITPRERQGQTGLFPIELNDYLPAGTAVIFVDVVFQGGQGPDNDAYADNLELVLTEYAP